MLLEIVLAILAGVTAGIITGLTPGIHVNLVSVLVLSLAGMLVGIVGPIALACFIIAMAVVHSFLDTIPSVFLGAPEESTALGVLPGHRYVLKGLGTQAVLLTVIGSLGGLVVSMILFPLFLLIITHGYPHIASQIGWILLIVIITMIIRDRRPGWALLVFSMAGVTGVIVLNQVQLDQPLFPLLSGLFGTSTLLYSLMQKQSIPRQKTLPLIMDTGTIGKAISAGQFSGFLTAVLPGLGAGTAAVIGQQLTRKMKDGGFLILIGTITTVNFVLSLATFYAIDKSRNGAIVAVKELVPSLPMPSLLVYLCVAVIAGGIAAMLAIYLSHRFSDIIQRFSYARIITSIILFITLLVFIFDGLLGLIVLLTTTAIGMVPAFVKTARIHSMGCLILPVMGYFLF